MIATSFTYPLTFIYSHTHTHTHTLTHTLDHTHTLTHPHTHTLTHSHILTYSHTHALTDRHTHIHSHTHTTTTCYLHYAHLKAAITDRFIERQSNPNSALVIRVENTSLRAYHLQWEIMIIVMVAMWYVVLSDHFVLRCFFDPSAVVFKLLPD